MKIILTGLENHGFIRHYVSLNLSVTFQCDHVIPRLELTLQSLDSTIKENKLSGGRIGQGVRNSIC